MSNRDKRIEAMEQHIAALEETKKEYLVFLNLVLDENDGKWVVNKERIVGLRVRPVRSVIGPTNITMTFEGEQPKLILPHSRE